MNKTGDGDLDHLSSRESELIRTLEKDSHPLPE